MKTIPNLNFAFPVHHQLSNTMGIGWPGTKIMNFGYSFYVNPPNVKSLNSGNTLCMWSMNRGVDI